MRFPGVEVGMSQLSQNVTTVTDVTAMSHECHSNVTDVTAIFPQTIENKQSGSKMSQTGCDSSYIKQVRIRNNARAGGRVQVRRVLWRRERIMVYQDTTGRYWWADLRAGKQRPAVVGAYA